jgi:hypothetical protein
MLDKVDKPSEGLIDALKHGLVDLQTKGNLMWPRLKEKFLVRAQPVREIENIEVNSGAITIDDQEVTIKHIDAIQLRHELERPWGIVDVFMIISSPTAKIAFGIQNKELRNFGTLDQNSALAKNLIRLAVEQKIPLYER